MRRVIPAHAYLLKHFLSLILALIIQLPGPGLAHFQQIAEIGWRRWRLAGHAGGVPWDSPESSQGVFGFPHLPPEDAADLCGPSEAI
jgi:hypothetical protein